MNLNEILNENKCVHLGQHPTWCRECIQYTVEKFLKGHQKYQPTSNSTDHQYQRTKRKVIDELLKDLQTDVPKMMEAKE